MEYKTRCQKWLAVEAIDELISIPICSEKHVEELNMIWPVILAEKCYSFERGLWRRLI